MRRKFKFLTAVTLAFLLVFLSPVSAFAAPNTSIHLKADANDYTVSVVLAGYYDWDGSTFDPISNTTEVPMNVIGGSSQYTTTDFNSTIDPSVAYFLINGEKYYVGIHIDYIGKEGGGTINYDLKSHPTYNVYYHGNHVDVQGTAPVDSNNYLSGDTVTVLSDAGVTVPGHVFVEWNTQADGNGMGYDPSDTFSMPMNDVNLYAIWEAIPTYNVYYDANHGDATGSVPMDSNDYYENDSVIVMDKGSLMVPGFMFVEWNTQADGNGMGYDPTDSFNMPANDVTLYAVWEAIPTYNVYYHANHANAIGSIPIDLNDYYAGDPVNVMSSGTLNVPGFTFEGWNTSADGLGMGYQPGNSFNMPANDVDLYAIWEEIEVPEETYNVYYDANHIAATGDAPVDNNDYYAGTLVFVKDDGTLAVPGHHFIEWNTMSNGTGIGYDYNDTFNMPESDVTLFAIWEEDEVPMGSITIIKEIWVEGSLPDEDFMFSFRITKPDESTETVHIYNEGQVTLNDLVEGMYVVSEIDYPEGFEPQVPTMNVMIGGNDGWDIIVTFINEYTPPVTTAPPTTAPPTTAPPTTAPPTTAPPTSPPTDPPVVDEGTVTIYYENTEGESLTNEFMMTGAVGGNYITTALEFDGYTLVETPDNADGVFIDGNIDVIYVYSDGTEPETLPTEEIPLGAPDPEPEPEEEIILEEEVPLGDALPQTGQLPPEMFYGIGSVMSLLGISLKRRKKE